MKNLLKSLSVLAFLMLFNLFSINAAPITMSENENNGVKVEMINLTGEIVLWIDCGDGWVPYYAKSGKKQLKNNALHLYKWLIEVPRDNCYIPSPDEGAYSIEIWGGTLLFTPSGNVIFKKVIKPFSKKH